MSCLVEELRAIILRALPTNVENTTELLIERLLESGVESKDDLQFVEEHDLSSILPAIKVRKLLSAFKMGNYFFISHLHSFLKAKVDIFIQ